MYNQLRLDVFFLKNQPYLDRKPQNLFGLSKLSFDDAFITLFPSWTSKSREKNFEKIWKNNTLSFNDIFDFLLHSNFQTFQFWMPIF